MSTANEPTRPLPATEPTAAPPAEDTQVLPSASQDWRKLGGPTASTPTQEIGTPAPAPIRQTVTVPKVSWIAIAWYLLALAVAILSIAIGAGLHLSISGILGGILAFTGAGLIIAALATLGGEKRKTVNTESNNYQH